MQISYHASYCDSVRITSRTALPHLMLPELCPCMHPLFKHK